MAYQTVKVPEGGAKISIKEGKLQVPDNPIIPNKCWWNNRFRYIALNFTPKHGCVKTWLRGGNYLNV